MSNEAQVKKLTDIMAQFVGFTAKKLPDDVIAKLQELRDKEDSPMTNVIYDTMFRNQELAKDVGLDEDFLTRLAESIENMDIFQWQEDFEAGLEEGSQMNAELQAQDEIAINLEIRDQPAAVVNGPGGTEVVQDAPDLAELQAAIGEVQ